MSQHERRHGHIGAFTIIYTMLIFFNNFAYGMSLSILGATMVDLSFVYRTSLETISSINFSFSIGYMIGSVGTITQVCLIQFTTKILYLMTNAMLFTLASYFNRWINRQMLLAILVLMQAVTLAALPFYQEYWLAFLMMVLSSVGAGGWDSATSIWIVELWPVRNSAILQGNQFMYGLGTIVAPLMAAPFVYGTQNETEVGNGTAEVTVDDRVNALTVPFAINGLAQGLVPVLLFILYFTYPYTKPKVASSAKVQNTQDTTPAISHRKIKLAIMGMCLGTYIAAEVGFMTFAPSMFQYLPVMLTASEAARVQSVMSTTFTLGRLATAFISLKVPIDIILGYHFVLQIGAVVLLYFSQNDLTLIYIGMAIMGLGFSALWPGIFGFTEQYLGLTDRICALYTFLVGITCLITPLILSTGFKDNPVILIYLTGAFIVTSATLFMIVRIWISRISKIKSIEISCNNNATVLREISAPIIEKNC